MTGNFQQKDSGFFTYPVGGWRMAMFKWPVQLWRLGLACGCNRIVSRAMCLEEEQKVKGDDSS